MRQNQDKEAASCCYVILNCSRDALACPSTQEEEEEEEVVGVG